MPALVRAPRRARDRPKLRRGMASPVLPEQRTDARHSAPLETGTRVRCLRALHDFDEGPSLETSIDARVDHLDALAAPQKTTACARIALPVFQIAAVRPQAHAPSCADDLVWLDCAVAILSVRGNGKIRIGVTLGVQASNCYPTVT